ncbi:MAG: hypothetical protein ACK41U_12855 [Paracoccus sp. (in: a-proteobacteria)]|uniref:hypothetical protein n=1 Tax=Paracoccus sp. TaxID=267 RepID=UPI00391C4404
MHDVSFCFILIERDCFIARDLREGLSEACPDSVFRCLGDLNDLPGIETGLAGVDQFPVVITKASLAELTASGVAGLVRRNGWAMAVRMGIDPLSAVHAEGWLSLAAPFSREDLVYLAEQLRARYPQPFRRIA